jgi:hypothetical protein
MAVSTDEQLPVDGFVRPKHIEIKCDFNDILKYRRDCEWFVLHYEAEMSEQGIL